MRTLPNNHKTTPVTPPSERQAILEQLANHEARITALEDDANRTMESPTP